MTAPTVRPRLVPAGHTLLRLPGGISLLVHRGTAVVTAVLTLAAVGLALATVLTGAYEITAGEALRTLTGGGSDLDRFVVVGQRVPRVIAAALVGLALAGAGAIFQSLSRNPLGSPDIIGFTTGAATGGLAVILLAGSATAGTVGLGTFAGGLLTAAAVVAVAARRGLTGDRIVLGGIAIAALLAAVNDYLLTRAPIEQEETARAWQHGSLNAITWGPVLPLAIALAVLVPLGLSQSRSLRALELGDDLAAGLGLPLRRARLLAIACGVGLTAAGVAVAGPIGFLALAAPQLARRLARSPGVSLPPAMAMGACLLVGADLLAQRLLAPFQIPVGLVTAAIGGAYLVWLLLFSPRALSAAARA
ncbi:iron chelate uptake ABC transporter family permease subunit [Brachybacterium horti]